MRATGNACGSHNNAKLSLVFRTNILIFESDENAGAFDPSGSINGNKYLYFSKYDLSGGILTNECLNIENIIQNAKCE